MLARTAVFVCALLLATPGLCQPQAVIRVPQDAPTIAAALFEAAGDTRIELAAGLYRESVLIEASSPTIAPQPGAEGMVSWSADLDADGTADGLAIRIFGPPTARPIVTLEGIDFVRSGIEAEFATLTIDRCSFTGNTAKEPRPLTAINAHVVITGSVFRDTVTNGQAGAVWSTGHLEGSLLVEGSTFERCRVTASHASDAEGGAIRAASAVVNGSTFRECAATGSGGAISTQFGLMIDDCTFEANLADRAGGAVDTGNWRLNTISRSVFRANRVVNASKSSGGAVVGEMRLIDCVFEHNSAKDSGGAVLLFRNNYSVPGPQILRCTFIGNTAANAGADRPTTGGAVYLPFGFATFEDCVFTSNTADRGGAISGANQSIDVINSTFVANQAERGSVAFEVRSMQNCVFIGNKGPVFLASPRHSELVSHSAFIDNQGPAFLWDVNTAPSVPIPLPIACVFGPGQAVVVRGDRPLSAGAATFGDPLLVGDGAITLDPMFTRWPNDGGDGWGDNPDTPDIDESRNDDLGDLTPLPGSPLIDAAPAIEPPAVPAFPDPPAADIVGNPRHHDDPGIATNRADIGPVEFQGESCLADVDRDGQPSPADLVAWINAFEARAATADQNRDGQVTPADFHAWILNFNTGC